VPRDVLAAAGAREGELVDRLSEGWCRAIGECVRVTREQFAAGRRVCDAVAGRLRYELRMTWLGGSRILDRVAGARPDLMPRRPTLEAGDWAAILWGALRWAHA